MRAVRAAWLALPLALAGGGPAEADPAARGEYVFDTAGCAGCHTAPEGERLAGGRALETPFGTFRTPNITPDPEHGIGGWSDADFVRAMREGVGPDGTVYYPAFPYTSYTAMTERDLLDLKAYLDAQPPVARANQPHDLDAPYGWRFLLPVWRLLHFEPGALPEEPERDAQWHRGRYLVHALGHCGECHTPRNGLGAMDEDRFLAGSESGPEGRPVPNITPHPEAGIGSWSAGDVTLLLELGMLPDGDFAGGGMNEVIESGTSRLTPEDRAAIAAYLMSLPPVGP